MKTKQNNKKQKKSIKLALARYAEGNSEMYA